MSKCINQINHNGKEQFSIYVYVNMAVTIVNVEVEIMNRTEKILNQMIDELELAIIKAKAQLEYVDGNDLSDMMRDEK